MVNISLGQYYPGQSVLHRMDPRAKVLASIIYIVASFLCKNFFSFVLLFASAILLILVAVLAVVLIWQFLGEYLQGVFERITKADTI